MSCLPPGQKTTTTDRQISKQMKSLTYGLPCGQTSWHGRPAGQSWRCRHRQVTTPRWTPWSRPWWRHGLRRSTLPSQTSARHPEGRENLTSKLVKEQNMDQHTSCLCLICVVNVRVTTEKRHWLLCKAHTFLCQRVKPCYDNYSVYVQWKHLWIGIRLRNGKLLS